MEDVATSILVILAGFTACVIHEGGHYLAALFLTGKKLRFSFSLGWIANKIPVPRFTWNMPWTPDRWRRKVIALSGFGLELLIAVILMISAPKWLFSLVYTGVSVLHFFSYRFYAGEASDFKWLS